MLSNNPLRRAFRSAVMPVAALAAAAILATSTSLLTPASAEAPKVADKVFSAEQTKAIQEIVKDYLINNPEVFLEIQQVLEAKMDKIQADKLKTSISENAKDIFHDPDGAIAGNPKGDITVVEFFDYNCGYCKRALGEVAKIIEKDPKLKVTFKELTFIGREASAGASRVALAARMQGKYWEMHKALLEQKGSVNEAIALKLADKLGLDMTRLKADMNGPSVKEELEKTRKLAEKMGINGTPHFLVGDRSIPGAPENLSEMIEGHAADLRKNGCSVC